MVKAGLVKSKSEARTAIQQGGVTVDDVKIADVRTAYTKADLADGKLFKKGKKTFVKVIAK
jgi:tyrosyl-tRNA synthetase